MKKIMIVLALIFSVSMAYAGSTLIRSATSTGAGNDIDVDGSTNVWVTSTFTNTSTMVIALEGTNDGKTTWISLGTYTMDSTDIGNGYLGFHVNNRTADYVRPNITTLTGGGATVSVTVSHE